MAKNYNFPFLVFLAVVHVKRGIAKDWHFDFSEPGTHKPKEKIRYSSFSGIDIENLIKVFVVLLCWNPFAV